MRNGKVECLFERKSRVKNGIELIKLSPITPGWAKQATDILDTMNFEIKHN